MRLFLVTECSSKDREGVSVDSDVAHLSVDVKYMLDILFTIDTAFFPRTSINILTLNLNHYRR